MKRFLILLLLALPASLGATTFMLYRAGNKLYIGADGIRINYTTRTGTPQCKIARDGKIVTLTWGLAGGGVGGRFESFSEQVVPISASKGSVFKKRDMLIEKAKRFLIRMMELRDANTKEAVSEETLANFTVGAAFVSMEKGVPDIGAFNLSVIDWRREIKLDIFPGNWNGEMPIYLGNGQAYAETIKKWHPDTDPVSFIKLFLERQHELTPEHVGPPYSIVVLSKSGLQWIEKGACVEKLN